MASSFPLGYLALVLHAHLPYVRHPEYADPLEERWLFEALFESYLPLLGMLDGWERDAIGGRLALSISPTLAAMLSDPLLMERCARRIEKTIELAESETIRTRWLPGENAAAWHYLGRAREARRLFEEGCGRNLLAAFDRHARAGRIELFACNATHAFLPLFQHQTPLVRAQITVGMAEFRRHFGRAPAGLWPAECGYYPGLDALLAECGLRYFFMDAHGVAPRGTSAAMRTPGGPAVFARNTAAAHQVWNARIGYPGDGAYREFYRDIGFDLEQGYIAPFVHESGLRTATGIKYHRVTGPVGLGDKGLWDPRAALARAAHHADDFAGKLIDQALAVRGDAGAPPLIVAPYDAELFGHWWYEGPAFLDRLMRRLAAQPEGIVPIAPSEYLSRHPPAETAFPSFSSWGEGGYAAPWLGPSTQWIYPLLHDAGDKLMRLARTHADTEDPLLRRGLNQLGREFMLAQSSDWAFMINSGPGDAYARKQTLARIGAFFDLQQRIAEGRIDAEQLAALEAKTPIFPTMEFEVFAGPDRIRL